MPTPDQPVTPATIDALTPAEQNALSMIAVRQDGRARNKPVRSLLAMELIERYPERIYGTGTSPMDRIPVIITRYALPDHVMYVWAQWCALTSNPDGTPKSKRQHKKA